MNLGLFHVTPAPLAGVIDSHTEVWNRECAFQQGKKYILEAPSGKGKSTCIHCLYGLRDDYTGSVRVDDRDVRDLSSDEWSELRRENISIVFQDLRLFLHLNGMDNLLVKAALYEDDLEEKINFMATELQVDHVLQKPSNLYSYGERQRIAIIRALIQPFDWLLLDEPFSHLDQANARRAATLISQEVSARNAGMIVTSLGRDEYFEYDEILRL